MKAASRVLVVTSIVAAGVLGACSSGGDGGGSGGASDEPLSASAQEGADIVKSLSCSACHSVDGRTSIGPSWKGLYGSEVQLDDGTTVTADDEYLTRAIRDPGSQRVEGFRGSMPDLKLSDDEIASIVDYLKTL